MNQKCDENIQVFLLLNVIQHVYIYVQMLLEPNEIMLMQRIE